MLTRLGSLVRLQLFDIKSSLDLLKGSLCCTETAACLCCYKEVDRVDVRYSDCTHVQNTGGMPSVYHNMINLVASFSIWKESEFSYAGI